MQTIERKGIPLTDVWSEGPAVAIPHREPENTEALTGPIGSDLRPAAAAAVDAAK